MKHLLPLLFLLTTIFAFGQTDKDYKIITVSEFEELLKTKKEVVLRDTYIKLDLIVERKGGIPTGTGKDKKFYGPVLDEFGETKGWSRFGITDSININQLSLYNCKLDEFWFENLNAKYIFLYNCTVNDRFFLKNSSIDDLSIMECIIKSDATILDSKFGKIDFSGLNTKNSNYYYSCALSFFGNKLEDDFRCSGNFGDITIQNSTITSPISFNDCKVENLIWFLYNNIEVDSSFFEINIGRKFIGYKFENNYPTVINISACETDYIVIENNNFIYNEIEDYKSNIFNYVLGYNEVNVLGFKNESIFNLDITNSVISNRFSIDSTEIQSGFSAKDLELPEYNIDFPWKLLANKINFSTSDSTNYKALTNEELADEKLYSSFITTYKKFFSVYKNKGDLKSANACYAEMKDVETRRLKYLYETEGGIDNLLNYQLNVFLKYFAEYGTSPIKSIKISGWVIIIFAFFYFFFYSDWDRINRKYLVQRGNNLILYFRSEQKLEDIYSDKHKDDLFTYTQFKQNLKDSKTEVPFFFMIFLKPLYWVAVIKHKFNSFLYKRVEFLQGRWVDLNSGKKWFLGVLTFFAILTYGIYLIAVRSLNSLILSINTFTTLGFGDIPVVGISRYVAILEGFLGWFLLSIFSVSLISQILQN